MFLSNSQDLINLVGAICLLWVSGFLCWALYEIARLTHQANDLVTDTREKVTMLEEFVSTLGEKMTALSTYAGLITAGSKTFMNMMEARGGDSAKKKKGKKGMPSLDELDDE
ncbi:hypothetical protein IT407_00445 [Candidatus Uhrbacteria bacterium]|nr:hypothetical protein [Candidatus Uhrbacteria bacterium]